MPMASTNWRKVGSLIGAIVVGLLLGVGIVIGALVALDIKPLIIALIGLIFAIVSLFISAKPDEKAKWFELGTRSCRSWWGLMLGLASFVLALAAVLGLL